MDVYEIVKKLVGPIKPVGESNADVVRFENLKVMTDLIDQLLVDIADVAANNTRQEFSMKRAGKYASDSLDGIKGWLVER